MQVIPEEDDLIETMKGNRYRIKNVLKSEKAVLVDMPASDIRDNYTYPLFIKFEDFKIIQKNGQEGIAR